MPNARWLPLFCLLGAACSPAREPVYTGQHGGGTLTVFADQPSPMYPGNKTLVLQVDELPAIAPEWGLIGQGPPYRPGVYGAAPVHYFDTSAPLDSTTDGPQLRMLYLNPRAYSPAQFEQVAKTLALGLPALSRALRRSADASLRILDTYRVAGVVYGRRDDFTQRYSDAGHALLVWPDGDVEGMEWVSLSYAGSVSQIAVNDTARVNVSALAQLRNERTQRRLQDDFPIVVEQYDAATSQFRPPVQWSSPNR